MTVNEYHKQGGILGGTYLTYFRMGRRTFGYSRSVLDDGGIGRIRLVFTNRENQMLGHTIALVKKGWLRDFVLTIIFFAAVAGMFWLAV